MNFVLFLELCSAGEVKAQKRPAEVKKQAQKRPAKMMKKPAQVSE